MTNSSNNNLMSLWSSISSNKVGVTLAVTAVGLTGLLI